MSVSYTLEMVTPSSLVDIAGRVLRLGTDHGVFEQPTTREQVLEGTGGKLGTWIRAIDAKPGPWNPVVEDLGITSTVSVLFWLGKQQSVHLQQDDMIRVVAGLLVELPFDAVLHMHREFIWLMRRRRELVLNDRDDLWTPPRLAMIQSSYRRAVLAFKEFGGDPTAYPGHS